MVPMLTCGLVRSNFCLAIWPVSFSAVVAVRRRCRRPGVLPGVAGLLAPALRADLLRHAAGKLGVGVELHGVAGPALRLGPEVADVAEHLRQRDERLDHADAGAARHAPGAA